MKINPLSDVFSRPQISKPISFEDFFECGRCAFVYGAGSAGEDVVKLLVSKSIRISNIIDFKIAKKKILGIDIINPDDSSISFIDRKLITVFIGIFNSSVNIISLRESLYEIGYTQIVDFTELHSWFPDILGTRYWLTDRSFYSNYTSDIISTYDLWSDNKSKFIYHELINFRLTGRPIDTISEGQYFPLDLSACKLPLSIIDCGAFTGDTIREICKLGLPLAKLAAFEPEPVNYNALINEIKKANFDNTEVYTWPCGVYSSTVQLKFNSGFGPSSHISSDGDISVPCVALDDVAFGLAPNFIKMDIEGAEFAALQGAKEIIKKYRPRLAICLYHNPEDIWIIPNLISAWNLNYSLHIRVHGYSGLETVLYAIPQ